MLRSALVVCLVFVLLAVVGEVALILKANHGQFGFSMDDAYIHLALSENIGHGHYGVNMRDASSPSSSLLWPFLLTPWAGHPGVVWYILALNTSFALCSVWLAWRTWVPPTAATEGCANPESRVLVALGLLAYVVAANAVGLIFTGLEHTLQVLACVAIVAGLAEEARSEGHAPPWLWWALALAPWVRYECLGLVLPAMLYLLWRGHVRQVLVAAAISFGGLAGFSWFLHTLGLPWLPNSIMAKLQMGVHGGGLSTRVTVFRENLLSDRGTWIALGILLTLAASMDRSRTQAMRGVALVVAGAGLIHLLFGRNGWYARYEDYILASMVVSCVWLYSAGMVGVWRSGRLGVSGASAMVLVGVLLLGAPYLYVLASTPGAARNIHLQQYQMHRFAADYFQQPVAVNDLGWVAWRNNQPVLDLYGLASTEALRLRTADQKDPDWMDKLMHRQHTYLAMLYDSWFPETPANWIKLGRLVMDGKKVIVVQNDVAFYITGCDAWPQAKAALDAFSATLPQGATFEWSPKAAQSCALASGE